MKKKVISLLLCLLFSFSFASSAYAANRVSTIDIDVAIYKDGSMYVTQVWEGDFKEGTENYIPMNVPDYLTISDFMVTDKNGTYETVSAWDVKADFKGKANKCGINKTDTGYEICFGISEYGHNRYAIEYKLSNVVGGYTDRDGVNFRFVNKQMNTTPTDVNVEIHLADGTPITDEMADIWGFGFEGQVVFDNGAIRAYTEKPINTENHVTVMFDFKKGVLAPARMVNDSFETVKQAAFDGSDYDQYSGEEVGIFEAITTMLLGIGLPLVLIIGAVKLTGKMRRASRMKKLERFASQFGYCREVPNEGKINATYALGRVFELCDDGAILGTSMLRLIDFGYLMPLNQEEVGLMGKTKEVVNLKLTDHNPDQLNAYDKYLYDVLTGAAGADGILQAKELENYAAKNDQLLREYLNKCDGAGREYLNQKQCITCWEMPAKLKYLTPSGEKELGELLGFKKYLTDFSLIAERGVKEIPIWKELLAYAMLLGIADKVAEQMKALYPDIAAEVTDYNQTVHTADSYHYVLYRNMKDAEERREQEARSKGSGGHSSLGGGGGSVGGGSGGGSR